MLVLLVGGFYGLAVGMDSGALIYIPRFTKLGSAIQKLIGGGIYIQTYRQIDTHIQTEVIFSAYFYFFQNKESRLQILPVVVCNT
jgi:hypothetical protein